MHNKIAPIGPTDSDVEFEVKACISHANTLRDLRKKDPEAYETTVQELQLIALGKSDPTAPVSPGMAESILIELDELNTVSFSRADVEAVLAGKNDEAYMGKPDVFVSFADAQQNGELVDDTI